jgi:cell division protein ftsL
MVNNNEYYYDEENLGSSDSGRSLNTGSRQQSDAEEQPRIRQRRTEARSGSVIKIIFLSLIAAALLGSVIYTLNKRDTAYNQVSSLNDELSLAEAENVRLQAELESQLSAKNVEDYAENVLGMQRIDSSQIKYIKIQTGDVVNIPEQEEGLMAKIKGFFDSCVEYFRG